MLCRYDSEMNDAPNAEKDHALWVFYSYFLLANLLPLAGPHSSKQMYGFRSSLARIYIKPLCLIFCRWQHFHWKSSTQSEEISTFGRCIQVLAACMLCRYDSEMNDAPNAEKDHALWVFYFNCLAFFLPLAGRRSSKQMYGFKSSLARIYIKPLCLIFCRWQHFHWKSSTQSEEISTFGHCIQVLAACMLCRYDSEMNDAPNAEKDHALWVFYSNFLLANLLPLAGPHSSKQMYGFRSSLARIYIKPLCLIFCRWQHFHWKSSTQSEEISTFGHCIQVLAACMLCRYDSEMNDAPNAEKDHALWVFYSYFLLANLLPLAGPHSSKQMYGFRSSLALIYIKPLCLIFCRWQHFHWKSSTQSEEISTLGHCIQVLAACMDLRIKARFCGFAASRHVVLWGSAPDLYKLQSTK